MKKKQNQINFSRIHPIKTVLRIEWLSFVYIFTEDSQKKSKSPKYKTS